MSRAGKTEWQGVTRLPPQTLQTGEQEAGAGCFQAEARREDRSRVAHLFKGGVTIWNRQWRPPRPKELST